MKKKFLLKKKKDITVLFRSLGVYGDGLKLLVKKQKGLFLFNKYFVSFKKKWGSSCERNLLKRRVLFYLREKQANMQDGYTLGFVFKDKWESYSLLEKELDFVLKKAGLWKP